MSNRHAAAGSDTPAYTLEIPPPSEPSPVATAQATWDRVRGFPYFSEALFGHMRPHFLDRAPIRLYGVDGPHFLYRDAEGQRRVFRANDHDRAGIASLFEGAEGWLCRLWPAPDGGWDDERAAETLLHFSGCIGVVDARRLGFELPPEPLW